MLPVWKVDSTINKLPFYLRKPWLPPVIFPKKNNMNFFKVPDISFQIKIANTFAN